VNHETEQKEVVFSAAGDSWEKWSELIVAVILGLATLGSAWSAYQSGL
jgi:hypothetical protein